jgi:hypothetical protein
VLVAADFTIGRREPATPLYHFARTRGSFNPKVFADKVAEADKVGSL